MLLNNVIFVCLHNTHLIPINRCFNINRYVYVLIYNRYVYGLHIY